jgi:hypothetical protein
MDERVDATQAEALRAVAAAAAAEGAPAHMRGRGIVVAAGGPVMIANAYVLVRVLRELVGSTLPIEIWHLGGREMPRFLARTLEALGCAVVDARAVMEEHPADVHDGWQLKAYALKHCRFAQVLLLDADQVPARDPAEAFAWPQFAEHGAVLWPDIMEIAEENPVWALCGLEPRQATSVESGQLLVDKQRHWPAVSLALAMNERADLFYRVVYGDKDVFLLAWLVTAAPYAMVPHAPFMDGGYFGQRDFDGAVLFQHRTNSKWSLSGRHDRPEGFRFQAECEAFLEDLRQVWDGRIFHAPARPAAALAAEAALVRQRHFTLARSGEAAERFELLPGHQIGAGRSYRAANWHVEEGAAGLELVVRDAVKPVLRLAAAHEGYWAGEALVRPGAEAVLAPADAAALEAIAAELGRSNAAPGAAVPRPTHEMLDDERLYRRT